MTDEPTDAMILAGSAVCPWIDPDRVAAIYRAMVAAKAAAVADEPAVDWAGVCMSAYPAVDHDDGNGVRFAENASPLSLAEWAAIMAAKVRTSEVLTVTEDDWRAVPVIDVQEPIYLMGKPVSDGRRFVLINGVVVEEIITDDGNGVDIAG